MEYLQGVDEMTGKTRDLIGCIWGMFIAAIIMSTLFGGIILITLLGLEYFSGIDIPLCGGTEPRCVFLG
jgi:hypothetical protein